LFVISKEQSVVKLACPVAFQKNLEAGDLLLVRKPYLVLMN
jgi:hypothetical protein